MAGSIPTYRGQYRPPDAFAGLRRFLRWWGRELAALVPARLRPLPRPASRFVWVGMDGDTVVIWRLAGGVRKDIERIDLAPLDAPARRLAFQAALRRSGRLPVGLCVPADQILRKTVSLPLAARENLRQVLGFELNRHSPFQAGQAYFDYRESGEDGRNGKLGALLSIAPRAYVDAGLSRLAEWGSVPHAVVPLDEIGREARYANLLPPEARPGAGLATRLSYLALALIPLLLLAAALAIPLLQKREVAIALDARQAEARREADAVDNLRRALDSARSEYQDLLVMKVSRPAAVTLVDEVTRLLPDDTWATQLEIKGREVLVSGETSSSSSLIRLMEKSALLEEAAFRSPLVKSRNNLERFQLGARIRETGAEAPAARPGDAEGATRKGGPSGGPVGRPGGGASGAAAGGKT